MIAQLKALFKSSTPIIRPMELDDVRWLWATHKLLDKPEVSQEEFTQKISSDLERFSRLYIVEDANAKFASGSGPVGMFVANYDGWTLEPHVEFFPWATNRNRVKSVVSFIHFQRHAADVGCVRIHASAKYRSFFKNMRKYVPIRVAGKVAGGRPGGDDHIFYVRGKRHG